MGRGKPTRQGLLALSLACLLLAACQPAPREYRQTLLSFGTLVEITFWESDKQKVDTALANIERDLNYMHEAWHAWHPGPLGRTNTLLETTEEFSANPSVIGLIEKSRELAIRSGHLFNPAVGWLIKLWGFHSDEPPHGPPPAQADIQALLQQNPRMDDITIKGVRMRSRNAAVKLDMGAVAKGYALDRLIEMLRDLGIKNAIINAGGDLKAIGRHGDRPWRVGIRHPRDKSGILAGLEVQDGESVFTSGDYERFYMYQGRRYHHIIDPRSGYPAEGSQSITVIHNDAATADAAATALFIAGPERWQEVAKAMDIKYVMLVDAQGGIHLTPAMQSRLQFKEPPKQIQLSTP